MPMRARLLRTSARWTGVCVVVAAGALAADARAAAPDFLDVLSVAGTTSAATAASIVPLLSTGVTGTPIPLPTAASGANKPLTISGSATSEGSLQLSADGRYLTLAGYALVAGTANAKSAVTRVVGRVDGLGNVDTTTTFSAFSADNVRGAVSDDGSRFWVTGAGGNDSPKIGIDLVQFGASSGVSVAGPTPSGGRVVEIAGGGLYLSSTNGVTNGVYRIGTGTSLPTTGGTANTALTSAGASDPYGFVLVRMASGSGTPDTLYVADGANGLLRKFALIGSTWTAEGTATAPAQLGSLAGRVVGTTVQLYATALAGSHVYSFADTSGASTATLAGTFATLSTTPSAGAIFRGIAFAPTGQIPPGPAPTASFSDSALGAVRGDSGNPPIGVTLADADPNVTPSDLSVSVASSNTSVAPLAGIALSGTGATRTISVTPGTKGYSTITLTVTAPDGHTGTASFLYGASDPAVDPATTRWLAGAADASTAIDVGGGYIVVGDDLSNVLRLYKTDTSGPPVKTWDFQTALGVTDQIDIEAAARRGNTIYWTGSMGNSSKGNIKPDESTLFATTVTGSGAATELTLSGFYKNLRNDLIGWDQNNGHGLGANALGFVAGAADGQIAKEINGFNVEGMEFAPGGSGTAYVGFRAPLLPPPNRQLALVVPVTNLTSLVTGAAPQATFGPPIFWNLGGLSVREIRKNASDRYLIIAGLYTSDPTFKLYTWDGNPAHQPVLTNPTLPTPLGSWESIVAVPDPLTSGSPVQFVEDDGDVDFYGDGAASKDTAFGLQKSRLDTFAVSIPPPTVTSCTVTAVRRGGGSGHDEMDVSVTDPGGLAAITAVRITNGQVFIGGSSGTRIDNQPSTALGGYPAVGYPTSVILTAVKTTQGTPTSWSFTVTNPAGTVTPCA